MSKPTLLVLAAGIGSRYGGLKQIEPIGPDGEIIIDYSIFDALRAGFGRVVFVIREDIAGPFRETIGGRFEERMDVDYVYQELDRIPSGYAVPAERKKPWGTGHAVLVAKSAIQGPFAVINADDFYGQQSYSLLADFLSLPVDTEKPCYSLVGFPLRNTLSDFGHVSRGICTCEANNRLRRVEELTHIERDGMGALHRDPTGSEVRLTGDEYASMNMWGFQADVFVLLERYFAAFLEANQGDLKAEFYLPTAVDRLINEGTVDCRVLPTTSRWAGVTYKDDRMMLKQFVEKLIAEGSYPKPLWRKGL